MIEMLPCFFMYRYWQRLQVHHVHYGVQYGPGFFWHCESFADVR